MLRLELLPAGPGDSVWLEYGPAASPHIMLIDGGLTDNFPVLERRIEQAMQERNSSKLHIDLLVVTHIDTDHILGILELLEKTKHKLTFGDIWFNGNRQLRELPEPTADEGRTDLLGSPDAIPRPDLLGMEEGDDLSKLLSTRAMPWNEAFGGAAIVVPDKGMKGELPCKQLACDLQITLLGPPLKRLRNLASEWTTLLEEYELEKRTGVAEDRDDLLGRKDTWPPYWKENISSDGRASNASSIVLLVEYEGKSLLLPGDAFATDIANGLDRLKSERNIETSKRVPLTAYKLSHHGSASNISRRLLQDMACGRYLISTDGAGYKHPDHQAILRIIKYSSRLPYLAFNYDVASTRDWRDHAEDVDELGLGAYETIYPTDPKKGLVLDLSKVSS